MSNLATIGKQLKPNAHQQALLIAQSRALLGEPTMGDDALFVIVALALLALWQSVQNGALPDGTIAPVSAGVPVPAAPTPQPSIPAPPVVTSGGGDMIDPGSIEIVNDPGDMLNVPITSRIVSIVCEPSDVKINTDGGINGWPHVFPPGIGDNGISFTVCAFCFIAGRWIGAAFIEGVDGYKSSDGVGDSVFDWVNNWWYAGRWGDLYGHAIAPGETVGVCLIGGDGRDGKGPFTGQRTQIVTFQATDNGTFQY